jgi:hypothetical protein
MERQDLPDTKQPAGPQKEPTTHSCTMAGVNAGSALADLCRGPGINHLPVTMILGRDRGFLNGDGAACPYLLPSPNSPLV